MAQLEMFERPRGVQPASSAELAPLARGLPERLRLGASSWSFPGWHNIVYANAYRQTQLAREGLWAYAQHPLHRAVGIDRTYYAPLLEEDFRAYAADVPNSFRFLVKAPEALTTARYPDLARYGELAGQLNPDVLDPGRAIDLSIAPAVDGLGTERLGVILFQLAPQRNEDWGGPRGFAERLFRFLRELPKGPAYAVELRNREWLTSDYAAALRHGGAVHAYNVHTAMPPLHSQRAIVGAPERMLVIRWMLGDGLRYAEARERYAPFDRLAAPDSSARDAVADLCEEAAAAKLDTLVIANNKAEGSAPLTLQALAERLKTRSEARGDSRR